MTEAEWLDSDNSPLMLEYLHDRVSDRKLRLFACACARRLWPLLTNEQGRQAIEVAERFANGRATKSDLEKAWTGAEAARVTAQNVARSTRGEASESVWDAQASAWAAQAAASAASRAAWWAAKTAATVGDAAAAARAARTTLDDDWIQTAAAEPNAQAALLREVIGNPFRPVQINPFWLHAHDDAVLAAAQAIDLNGQFEALPRLADLLVAADCHNEDLLTHCRAAGGHVRGCWVIDALLGRT